MTTKKDIKKEKKFRKGEIRRYNNVIDYIREDVKGGRDFWSSLFTQGLTFNDDIERFCHYASQVGALDISEEILKRDNFKHLI